MEANIKVAVPTTRILEGVQWRTKCVGTSRRRPFDRCLLRFLALWLSEVDVGSTIVPRSLFICRDGGIVAGKDMGSSRVELSRATLCRSVLSATTATQHHKEGHFHFQFREEK